MLKYTLDSKENEEFLKKLREELLAFGHKFPAKDGSSYYLMDGGIPDYNRPRETWITSRMAHVYSIGAMLGHEGAKELAKEAIKGLNGVLHDSVNGGYYAGITCDGGILEGKQCYAHAFVILAATSAIKAGIEGAQQLLDDALAIYDERFWDEEEGLAYDTWNTEFTELDGYRGLNSNMHSVEAFLAAADALDREEYRVRAGRIIDKVIIFAEDNSYRIPEHYNENWIPNLEYNKQVPDDPFKPYGATPGHGIEWARLIVQWALSTYRKDRDQADYYIDIAEKLYNRAVFDAWKADGAEGFVYTTDWEGNPIVHDRMHWTLAEAINTSSSLFHVTEDPKYSEDYTQYMKYLDNCVLDKVNGSWKHQMDRDNNVIDTVWPGKSDIYHAFFSTLIPYAEADISMSAYIADKCRENN